VATLKNCEEQTWCPECGSPYEVVQSKSQPTCICHSICDVCGGRIVHYLLGEDPSYPDMSGEWCNKCGPFGRLDG
jgi:hypothetical protein